MELYEIFGGVTNPTVYNNLTNDEILYFKGLYGYEKFIKKIGISATTWFAPTVKIIPIINFYNILIELGMAKSIESAKVMTDKIERANLGNCHRKTVLTCRTVNNGNDIRVIEEEIGM